MINAKELEQWFWDDIKRLRAHPALVRKWVNDGSHSNEQINRKELRDLQSTLTGLDKKRQRAWDIALDENLGVKTDLPQQLKRLSDQELIVRDRIAVLEASLKESNMVAATIPYTLSLIRDIRDHFAAAPYERQRELCNAVVAAVGGATATKGGIVWRSGRVSSHAPAQSGSLASNAAGVVRAAVRQKSS